MTTGLHSAVTGRARLGKRTKQLVKRLEPGDIAVIDHLDLDRVSAEELIAAGVRVVVNVAASQSGRYPNPGPLALVRGGVVLVDAPGAQLFEHLEDGDEITVSGGTVRRGSPAAPGEVLAEGRVLDEPSLLVALAEQQERVHEALAAFADNTMRYLRDEGHVLMGGIAFPPLRTGFRDRHALVIARGPGFRDDLRAVRGYIRDFRPVLVAVDGGADALCEAGYVPDVVVGDMDSVSDDALRAAREVLVHAYPDGRAPGAARLDALGVPYVRVPAPGISEDLALLLAFEKGAELIVAVGTHMNLIEFLERNRQGMSSTFVTRLKVGEVLVDAKGVSRLVSRRAGVGPLVAFAAGGLGLIVVAILASPGLRHLIELAVLRVRDVLGLG